MHDMKLAHSPVGQTLLISSLRVAFVPIPLYAYLMRCARATLQALLELAVSRLKVGNL